MRRNSWEITAIISRAQQPSPSMGHQLVSWLRGYEQPPARSASIGNNGTTSFLSCLWVLGTRCWISSRNFWSKDLPTQSGRGRRYAARRYQSSCRERREWGWRDFQRACHTYPRFRKGSCRFAVREFKKQIRLPPWLYLGCVLFLRQLLKLIILEIQSRFFVRRGILPLTACLPLFNYNPYR